MDTKQQVQKLCELERLDRKTTIAKSEIGTLPQKSNELEATYSNSLKEQRTTSLKNREALLRRNTLELDIKTERSHLRKWENRAADIQGERDYAALVSEIGGKKRIISDLETKALEEMEILSTTEQSLLKLAIVIEDEKNALDTEKSRIAAGIQTLSNNIESFSKTRESLLSTLPEALKRRYERIAKSLGGKAIALVSQEVCQSCSRKVPPELFMRVVRAEVVEQCPFCRRILISAQNTHQDPASQMA